MVSIGALNALPAGVREQLYLRLIPGDLIDRFGVDPATLRGPAGDRLVRITAAEDKTWARIELRHREQDRDPVLLLDVGMSAFGAPELSLVQVIDPTAPRFGMDRDPDGHDRLLGTASRNVDEEVRALGAGLAPGQVRQGLRMLAHVLQCMDDFCRLLGRDFYLVEPLFYHSALHYERHGCDYFIGRDRMDQIHAGFQPGGALCGRLDGSTPFRRPGFAQTVRGRSWAIHDGVLGGGDEGGGRPDRRRKALPELSHLGPPRVQDLPDDLRRAEPRAGRLRARAHRSRRHAGRSAPRRPRRPPRGVAGRDLRLHPADAGTGWVAGRRQRNGGGALVGRHRLTGRGLAHDEARLPRAVRALPQRALSARDVAGQGARSRRAPDRVAVPVAAHARPARRDPA